MQLSRFYELRHDNLAWIQSQLSYQPIDPKIQSVKNFGPVDMKVSKS